MALPNAETGVMEMVAEEEAQAKRAAALAGATAATATATAAAEAAPVAEQAAVVEQTTAVATTAPAPLAVTPASIANASDFLAAEGITDLKLDFTSFPVITLNDAVFSSPDFAKFGTEFEFRYISKRPTFLFRGDFGRTKDPQLLYSSDGVHADSDGRPAAEHVEEWSKLPDYAGWERKEYTMVLGVMVNSVHEGEMVQLQIPHTSRGVLDGYLVGLGTMGISPRAVITKVIVGAERGKGIKTFNPWKFQQVK